MLKKITMNNTPDSAWERVLPDDLFTIQDLETLRVASDPLRLQILNVLRGEPRTVKEIARVLHLPQTKLYYHINLLEKHGLIRVVGTRLVSGILEKQYQASAYKFSVAYNLLTPMPDPQDTVARLDVFLSAVLDYTHSDMLRSVRSGLAEYSKDAPPERLLEVGRLWFRLTPEQVRAFREQLTSLFLEYQALSHEAPAEGAQFYELLLGFYPTHEHSPIAGEEQMSLGSRRSPPAPTNEPECPDQQQEQP